MVSFSVSLCFGELNDLIPCITPGVYFSTQEYNIRGEAEESPQDTNTNTVSCTAPDRFGSHAAAALAQFFLLKHEACTFLAGLCPYLWLVRGQCGLPPYLVPWQPEHPGSALEPCLCPGNSGTCVLGLGS